MENNPAPQRPAPDEKNTNAYIPLSKIILAFCLLALGFGSFSVGNFMTTHEPGFFYIYSNLGITTYYIVQTAITPIGFLLIGIALFLFISPLFKKLTAVRVGPAELSFQEEDIQALRDKADRNPDKIEPIWDLGRANLQEYFNRNLGQISNIYRVSVVVMIVSFLLIVVGILAGLIGSTKGNTVFAPALIGVIAGIISEFIGATFLYMYRATVQQATEFMKTLERINRVGMATKILDTMSDDSKELRDQTKAALVKLLFSQNLDQIEETKDSPSKNGRKKSHTRTQTNQTG